MDEYYRSYYQSVHSCGSTGLANDRLQIDIEAPHHRSHFGRVLELGAGNLGHVGHVRHAFDTYIAADIRTPPDLAGWSVLDTFETLPDSGRWFAEVDAQDLPFHDASFDRLVTSCLLMHLDRPEEALAEWRRVVRSGGTLDLLIPCDPGLAVRTYRMLFSRPKSRRLGFDQFDLVNALDHKRPVNSLVVLAREVFRDDRLATDWYPFRFVPSWNLNSHVVVRVHRA